MMALQAIQVRALSSPGADPLHLMVTECKRRNLCDETGYRLPGVHWTLSVAATAEDPLQAPFLRTIGIQRISENGIDFVVKKGSGCSKTFVSGRPISVLHLKGKYVAGEIVEQWRAEGHCEKIPLAEVIDVIPSYTLNAMIATKRLEQEIEMKFNSDPQQDRLTIMDNSHVHEVVQSTRMELEAKTIDKEEFEIAIRAYRFRPDRMERMTGGPETILWDRWEWRRASGNCPEGSTIWDPPTHLMPH